MRSAKLKIRRKKNRSTMNFVTALKRSGSVQIKKILVPLSSSTTVSARTNLDSHSVEAVVDHNSEPMCPDTIGDIFVQLVKIMNYTRIHYA